MAPEFKHISVLRDELVQSLHLQAGSIAVDCTAGGGGHTELILQAVGPQGKVLAFDRDPWAREVLTQRFQKELDQGILELIPEPYSQLENVLSQKQLLGKISGVCADIGVSSPQIDHGERGFSFAKDGPLDMRMDPTRGVSAAEVVNTFPEAELLRIFREFGEEPKAHFIVKAIAHRRAQSPISTTFELSELIAANVHYKERSRKNPATKVFQALRIFVNDELGELEALLKAIPAVLAPQGRCSIITFHSLEDRMVKLNFKALSEGDSHQFDRRLPLTAQQLAKLENRQYRIIKPFPLVPSDQEQESNPRSRSAKLRVIERLSKETET